MRRLLNFLRRHAPFVAAIYRLLLLTPVVSGEIVLSMISLAGLTLTTLPAFRRLSQRPAAPQLEQRVEKQIFDESALSNSIRAELEKAARLLPTEPPYQPVDETVVEEAEIEEAEWTDPSAEHTIEETEVSPEPDLEPAEAPAQPITFRHYPFSPIDLLDRAEPLPVIQRYPVWTESPLTVSQTFSPTLPHYPRFETALLTTPKPEASVTALPHYPRIELNAFSLNEEEAFEEEETTPIETADEEAHEWLPARERADALFTVCQLYSQIDDTEIPLTVLIGGADEDELLQLSSESLDGAIHLKEQIDETVEIFGFSEPQALFDHLFYCSISNDRTERLRALLSVLSPLVRESMMINDEVQREGIYQQIFDHLFEAGEFLSSERPALFEKWHQEFIPTTPPEVEEENDGLLSPEETFTTPSESAQERIAAALENLQKQQELELTTPAQQERASVELEREKLSRKRKISRIDKLAKQQGLPLDSLLDDEQEKSRDESDQLLNLLLSARSDPSEEYTHFRGHLKGTPADLLIETLLRIKLQNRTCTLFHHFQHLDNYERIEQRIFDHLREEFGATVVKNHRSSIEQHIEWASSSDRPHCNDGVLPHQAAL